MAGNYSNPPGNRLAYDKDGTQVTHISSEGIFKAFTQAQLTAINDDYGLAGADLGVGGDLSDTGGNVAVIFPTPRDLVGFLWASQASSTNAASLTGNIWSSTDTTNGYDGTWTDTGVPVGANRKTQAEQRDAITPLALTGVKGIRMARTFAYNHDLHLYTLHLYGKHSGPTNRLEFWHPTLDEPLTNSPAHLDWGDRVRGTSEIRRVRVKNLSGSLTAQAVTVGVEALTDASPTVVSQYQLVFGGGAPGATAAIGDLIPGAISGEVEITQDLLNTAALGLWSQRLYATAGAWV